MHRSVRLQRRALMLLLVLFALGGVVSQVEAAESMRGDRCEIPAGRVINDDFYFFCRILDVRGTVNGDLVGIASSVTLHENAVIAGDVWVGGGELVIAGDVGDDIRFGGVTLVVEQAAQFSSARIDIVSLALNTEIGNEASFPGDMLVYGYQARINGTLDGDLDFNGEALMLNGAVEGNVTARVGDPRRNTDMPDLPIYNVSFADPGLITGEGARIGGNLRYKAVAASFVPLDVVEGRIRFEQTGGQPDITQVDRPTDAAAILTDYIVESVRDVLSLVILGVVSLRVVPNLVRQPAQHVRRRTVPTIGWGLLTFMLSIPIIITVFVLGLVVLLLLYLIKLSELTIMVGAGVLIVTAMLVGGISFLLLFMGRLVVSFMIGQMLYRYGLRVMDAGTLRRWIGMLVLGTTVYALITNMPVPALGVIIELVTALAGVGAVVMYMRRLVLDSNLFATREQPVPEMVPVTSVTVPPAPEQQEPPPPGMENLPEGFTGFDEDW